MTGVVPFPTTHNGGPTMEDAPSYGDRSRRRDPWFKFYPADWLRDTRYLTLEQRGAYIDSIAIQMERGEPVPDDVTWLSHQLHISTRKARSLVQQLVDAKMLLRKNGTLTNNRCEREIAERESQRVNASHSASVRERAKREPALNQTPVNDEPELNHAPVNSENSKKPNEINETPAPEKQAAGTTRAGAHARLDSDTEREKEEPPLSPKGKKDEPIVRKDYLGRPIEGPDADVIFNRGQLTLVNGLRSFWLQQFDGDAKRLDLAIIQAAGYVQPNSTKSLAAQVGSQLARIAGDKHERASNYSKAAAANKAPAKTNKPKVSRW